MVNYDVVIIGAGQAGIAMGYYLKQAGISFVLLDANERIGDSWRNRYESLVLFTPRGYSSLPGLEMNGSSEGFPTKNEMANYLETYVEHFELPIKLKNFVQNINRDNNGFELLTNQGIIKSKQVVIASGAFQKPFIPPVITENGEDTQHIHSSSYNSPSQIPEGSVLVIGGGNSGSQIAVELAQQREVTLAVGYPLKFLPLRLLGKSIFKWLKFVGLLHAGIDTKRGRWFRKQRDPIFGNELKRLIDKDIIKIKGRVTQVENNEVIFQDKSNQSYDSIIWATGFAPYYKWVNIEGVYSSNGTPIHKRGVSPINGLYFIGLPWQYQRGSALICGVAQDAEYLLPFILQSR